MSQIFCRHGYSPKCRHCRARDRVVDVLNLLLYALAVFIVLYSILQAPAHAYPCHWVVIDGKNVWWCDYQPEPPPEPDPPPPPPPRCPPGHQCRPDGTVCGILGVPC